MSNPLQSIALWRAGEGAVESSVPLVAAGFGWWVAYTVASTPAAGRPLTPLELAVLLGACAALTSWAVSRQLHLVGRKKPRTALLTSLLFGTIGLLSMRPLAELRFTETCLSELGGGLARVTDIHTGAVQSVCQLNGVSGNSYLPGSLIFPNWSGDLTLPLLIFLGIVSSLSALGLRDWRLRPTRIPGKLYENLRLAPASGAAGVPAGPRPQGAAVQACGNATMWGEICGQIYSLEKEFEPGEWCPRCQQVYRRAERELSFTVVSLFTADVDVLNGLERMDTVSWRRGEPIPPDARISGRERWVALGTVSLPDVITVAQALSLVHGALSEWGGEESPDKEARERAVALAQQRASRICAWMWFGRHVDRLTYARPTDRVRFAIGPSRLKDLVGDTAEPLVLQLDIGLLPLELRVGFKKTFLDRDREAELQNSKLNLWIPVGPPDVPPAGPGLWVDRIEGDALRAWVSTERVRPDEARGVATPLPYQPYDPEVPVEHRGEGAPAIRALDIVRAGRLKSGEPDLKDDTPGRSIAEWDWLEWEQIQLLRQQALVMVEAREESR